MKGDFTRIALKKNLKKHNFSGVLHQQGKVLLDRDWNEQRDIIVNWQDQSAKDIFGPGVAAIPTKEYENFQIRSINPPTQNTIGFTITPGRIWADGHLIYLEAEDENVNELTLSATPLYGHPSSTANTSRIAILLEVWREVISGFQIPDLLLEPALGGIDTTERLHTAFAFRYYPLTSTDKSCRNVREIIKGILATEQGTLTVDFEPTEAPNDECPMEAWSGYIGLEHRLYRVEVARTTNNSGDEEFPPVRFKWSRYNGGLVGRGKFLQDEKKVKITSNLKAILGSKSTEFYMEIVQYNSNFGFWEPTFGATVVLTDDNTLSFAAGQTFLNLNRDRDNVFFRLWDGIEQISDYEGDEPNYLEAGIRLKFDRTKGNFRPGDYWVFPVRAMMKEKNSEDVFDPEAVLPNNKVPDGIKYSLVPLAIIYSEDGTFEKDIKIIDCRIRIRLGNQNICWSFLVGDDGDGTILDAIDAL
ncbi:MAG: DUF6519 domain-containing protein, partial [Candidatus Hodarchaeota archaeon]